MQGFQLVQVLRSDGRPARFYVNSRRVSKAQYEHQLLRGRMHGQIECLTTKAKQLPGGHFKRWNYTSVRY